MRLEDDDQAPVTQLASGLQRCPDLGRMVAVIVVHGRALEKTEELEPPVSAWKMLQGGGHVCEAHPHLQRHGRSRGGVGDVVATPLTKVDAPQLMTIVLKGEGPVFAAPIVGRVREAVSDPPGRR